MSDTAICEAVISEAVYYLPNGDPGYPAEYCENEAAEGSDYCEEHNRDFQDEADDLAFEMWRDSRWDD
jgi:hypothetical protein